MQELSRFLHFFAKTAVFRLTTRVGCGIIVAGFSCENLCGAMPRSRLNACLRQLQICRDCGLLIQRQERSMTDFLHISQSYANTHIKRAVKERFDMCSQTQQQDGGQELQQQQEQILEFGSVGPCSARHLIHCLNIIGQVEGHYILPPQNKTTKYEHIIPALVAIEQDRSVEGLVMILNTVGGDVEGLP